MQLQTKVPARSLNGVYARRMDEIAKKRATRENTAHYKGRQRWRRSCSSLGSYEPVGERISTSKARAMIQELGTRFVQLVMAKRGGDATAMIKHIKSVLKDA